MQVCGTYKEKETLLAYSLCQENGDEIKLYILNSLNQLEIELNNETSLDKLQVNAGENGVYFAENNKLIVVIR